ncbi:hypothetical protein NO2A_01649 [Planktothrix agardhii]|nr:hypothetical protein NO2A_01649 [Planktothrix agardhii]
MAKNETRNEVEVRSQKVDELRELGIETLSQSFSSKVTYNPGH